MAVWKWWERRRLRYNRDLFLVGVASLVVTVVTGSAAVPAGEDFVEPMMLVIGPAVLGVGANIAFTAGPLLDVLWYRGGPRRYLLRLGYWFSLVLTSLPGVWALIAWLATLATERKL